MIGAGLYGCTVALALAEKGWEVDLFDRQSDIMLGATRANQGRLHHGYHYPRSPTTMLQAKVGARLFQQRYADCIQASNQHFYALAEESRLSWEQYGEACRGAGLPFLAGRPSLSLEHVKGCLWAPETFVNFDKLGQRIRVQLFQNRVRFHPHRLTWAENRQDMQGMDLVVDTTYGRMGMLGVLRFEVTELVVVKLPSSFEMKSVVVMDGAFVSVDPTYWHQGLHHLYHVEHSVHAAEAVRLPEVYSPYARLVDAGPIHAHRETHFEAMRDAGARYLPGLRSALYVESLFTLRAVLPDVDDTDARPSLVRRVGDRTIAVLGGKLGDAIATGGRVAEMAEAICLAA